eukprot:3825417-Rhodomonas_salina.1
MRARPVSCYQARDLYRYQNKRMLLQSRDLYRYEDNCTKLQPRDLEAYREGGADDEHACDVRVVLPPHLPYRPTLLSTATRRSTI